MIITGLLGALTASRYKWGFFVFVRQGPFVVVAVERALTSRSSRPLSRAQGCVAMFWIFWVLFFPARKSASHLGTDYHRAYTSSAIVLCTLWTVYPIIWGVCDGGNVITPTSEMVACESSCTIWGFLEGPRAAGTAFLAVLQAPGSLSPFLDPD